MNNTIGQTSCYHRVKFECYRVHKGSKKLNLSCDGIRYTIKTVHKRIRHLLFVSNAEIEQGPILPCEVFLITSKYTLNHGRTSHLNCSVRYFADC